MIHAGEHAHHAPTTVEPQQATDSWQVESMVKSDDGDHEGEHDHCLATHDRRKALRAAPAEPNLARTYAFGVIRRVPCDLVPVFERFRIAPKTSPPAA